MIRRFTPEPLKEIPDRFTILAQGDRTARRESTSHPLQA
jgi:hypothetical protein